MLKQTHGKQLSFIGVTGGGFAASEHAGLHQKAVSSLCLHLEYPNPELPVGPASTYKATQPLPFRLASDKIQSTFQQGVF